MKFRSICATHDACGCSAGAACCCACPLERCVLDRPPKTVSEARAVRVEQCLERYRDILAWYHTQPKQYGIRRQTAQQFGVSVDTVNRALAWQRGRARLAAAREVVS